VDATLIFIHLPRTAGTSLRRALEGRFEPEESLFVYDHRSWAVPRSRVAGLDPERLRRARLVYGHAPFGLHRALPGRSRYLTVLRDPVERVVSHYQFHVKVLAQLQAEGVRARSPLQTAIEGGRLALEDYARGTAPAPPPNLMARWIAGVGRSAAGDPEIVTRARANIERRFLGIGFIHRLQGFIDLVAERLGWEDPPVAGTENVNVDRSPLQSLEPETAEEIARNHALDVSLYRSLLEDTGDGGRLLPR
jgi:hypothetical protein